MKKGPYYNEEIDDKAIFGSYLIIAAGAGLILGAWLPWAHFLNDGQGWVYGLDGVGKYTAPPAFHFFSVTQRSSAYHSCS